MFLYKCKNIQKATLLYHGFRQIYNVFLRQSYSKEEAQHAIKRIVETKTLAFIGEMNRAQEEARKENRGIRRIRNQLRRWFSRTWQRIVLEFHIHFF